MRYAYVGCRTTKERNARGEGLKTYEIQPDGSWKCLQCLEQSQTRLFQTSDGEGKYLLQCSWGYYEGFQLLYFKRSYIRAYKYH